MNWTDVKIIDSKGKSGFEWLVLSILLTITSFNSDGRDLRDCTLPQDIKKFLGEMPDFSEELPGENIFLLFHPYVTVSFWCFYKGYARDVAKKLLSNLTSWKRAYVYMYFWRNLHSNNLGNLRCKAQKSSLFVFLSYISGVLKLWPTCT